ncbi:hypothetical protein HK104_009692 [Borealophlyctis nickersoniae]|nr:hypothetical protein HK104_009692 [Borealophlyctis nickersoniae]
MDIQKQPKRSKDRANGNGDPLSKKQKVDSEPSPIQPGPKGDFSDMEVDKESGDKDPVEGREPVEEEGREPVVEKEADSDDSNDSYDSDDDDDDDDDDYQVPNAGIDGSDLLSVLLRSIQPTCSGGFELPTHVDVAEVVTSLLPGYLYCNSSKSWWKFEGHTWRTLTANPYPHAVAKKMVSHIQAEQEKGGLPRENKKINFFIRYLKQDRHNIAKACLEESSVYNTHEKFAEHPHLLGFNNGILDLYTGQLSPGTPEQYVLHQCDYDYSSLESLQQNRDADLAALETGKGATGMSTLVNFMCYTLGKGAFSTSADELTQKIGRKANDNLSTAMDCDFVALMENDVSDKCNAATLKLYLGGDQIPARATYGKSKSGRVSALIVVCTNVMGIILDLSNGTWRRVQVQQMRSEFVSDESQVDVGKHIYLKNHLLEEPAQLKKFRAPLMTLLADFHLRHGRNPDVPMPAAIAHTTKLYHDRCCPFTQFFKEHTIVAAETEKTKRQDLLHAWKQYHAQSSDWKKIKIED